MATPTRRVQFTHFLLYKIRETRFRLSELLNFCQASRRLFAANQPEPEGGSRVVNFHFSAFSSLFQTIKDVLPVVSDQVVTWAGLSDIRHAQFMHAVRNAITHDGNPIINMWIEGKYYVACNFVRVDQHQKAVQVQAPAEDIETLATQFTLDLCSYLHAVVRPLAGNEALTGPLYGSEFFEAAIDHPAVPEFARHLHVEIDHSAVQLETNDLIGEVLSELDALANFCISHSEEI